MSFEDNQTANRQVESLSVHSTELVSGGTYSTKARPGHVKPEYRVENYEFIEGVERFSDADPEYEKALKIVNDAKAIEKRRFKGIRAETIEEYLAYMARREAKESASLQRNNEFLCENALRNYVSWVQNPILLVFRHVNSNGERFSVRRAAKRGDRAYRKQVLDRMNPIFEACEDIEPYFNRHKRKSNALTNCLYLTGTIPHDKSLKQSWRESLPYHFNLFMGRIKRKYGKALIVWRTWEAHKDGYPHFHAIILFPERNFTCFRYKNKWRAHSNSEIRTYWGSKYNHSSKTYVGLLEKGAYFNMDIQAMDSLKGGLSYVAKYITKATKLPEGYKNSVDASPEVKKQLLTLSLMWHFHKRAYSTSQKFIEYANALIVGLGNSTGSSAFDLFWAALDPFWRVLDPYLVELIGFYYGEGNAEWFCGWLPDRLKVPLYLEPGYYPKAQSGAEVISGA